MLFWRYFRDMKIYFGYFGHVWLRTPKMIVSPCRKLQCLSVCQKQTSSFTSSLRYYILENHAIWLADSLLAHNSRTRILPDIGLVMKYQKTISFHFRLFLRKTNEVFQNQKTLFWSHFGPSLPKFVQKLIFLGKRALSVLHTPIIYHRVKNQKKLMSHSLEKCWTDGQTNRRTERQRLFYRTHCRTGVQKAVIENPTNVEKTFNHFIF